MQSLPLTEIPAPPNAAALGGAEARRSQIRTVFDAAIFARGLTVQSVIAGEMTANAAAREADWRNLVSVGIVAIPIGDCGIPNIDFQRFKRSDDASPCRRGVLNEGPNESHHLPPACS